VQVDQDRALAWFFYFFMESLTGHLERLKGKKIMVVFPHPDDESMMTGGLLYIAGRMGIYTVVVTLTRGGAGKIHIHPKGKSLAQVREHELRMACSRLGVNRLIIGDFSDGKLKNERNSWSSWLKKTIFKERPSMIITYDHSGLTGHPDHIALSKETLKIARYLNTRAKDEFSLFWVSLDRRLKRMFVPSEVSQFFCTPTHYLDIGIAWVRKWMAVKCHRSQRFAQIKLRFPLWLFLSKNHFEWYYKVDLDKKYSSKYMNFDI
jgi:LmbE family N-acetylglucosaminyl deacetylase